ncbi:MAG: hypothetical protein AAF433_21815 [Bacteroidota bacterium]
MRALAIISCFLLALSMSLNAQEAGQDIVHLKNGQSYQGIIIEQKPGQYLRMLVLPDQDTTQLAYADIDRIAREVIVPSEPVQAVSQDSSSSIISPAYFTNKQWIQIHSYLGAGDYSLGGLGVTISHALNQRWLLGAGVHYISQTNERPFRNQQFVALSADVKWRFSSSSDNRLATYLVFNGGYHLPFDRTFTVEPFAEEVRVTNTWYFNPSLGFRFNVFRNMGLMFDIGYQLTLADYVSESTGESLTDRNFQNVTFRGTLIF